MLKFLFDLCAFPFRLTALAFCLPIQAGVTVYEKIHAKQVADECPLFKDIPEKPNASSIDASWPPAPHAVESLSVQELINANGKLIRDICYATTLNDEETQKVLLPVITNLARIVHLCPASEYDHHQGYGGLFTHSLETAYFAANSAKNKIFDRSAPPKDQYFNKCRWILVAVLAALAHDIGKTFSDIEITTEDGKRWDHQSPILDWLRKNKIPSYYIAFKQGRDHNAHKSFSLSKSSLLIPQKTWDFLSLTGYGEAMTQEFNDAILLGNKGGLIGRILDNADGMSRNMDMKRQRQIKPEFKNISHPQANELLKAIRALVNEKVWAANTEDGHVFVTKQGCFVLWNEVVAAQARDKAQSFGAVSLPLDYIRLAAMLAETGVAVANTDEVSSTFNLFWQITPIVLGTTQVACIRIASPDLIFNGNVPSAIEVIVDGLAVDEATKTAWKKRWNFVPKLKLSRHEEELTGYTQDFVTQMTVDAAEREHEHTERMTAESSVPDETLNDLLSPLGSVAVISPEPIAVTTSDKEAPATHQGIDESKFDMAALLGESETDNTLSNPSPLLPSESFAPRSETEKEANLSGLWPSQTEDTDRLESNTSVRKTAAPDAKQFVSKSTRKTSKKDSRTEGEKVFEQTKELVMSMAQQICLRSGLWLEGGRQMDVETSRWFTGSRLFEKELSERGVTENLFRLVIDELEEADVQPRIELDRLKHRIYLIGNGEMD